jgi:hypothetical protein
VTSHATYTKRDQRRYQRAVRRAFAQVTFYREQCVAAGRLLAEPDPTPVAELPQPPHTLCPFARPWSPDREPPLWTPTLHPLARALQMAGAYDGTPVLEVRGALLDHARLPRSRGLARRPAYRVLLSPAAVVASEKRRAELNREAVAVADAAGGGWAIGGPEELAAIPEVRSGRLRPVQRLPLAAVAAGDTHDAPALLYEPMLGYLGALVPQCRRFHLDSPRVYVRERDGVVTVSLPRQPRPTLLDIVPAAAGAVMVGRCERHGKPTLTARYGG